VRRSADIRGFQQRFSRLGKGRDEGQQNARRSCHRIQNSGEVYRLYEWSWRTGQQHPNGLYGTLKIEIQDKIRDVRDNGYCVLKNHFARTLIEAGRDAFWPCLLNYLEGHASEPNRGPHRHFVAMPFEPPCFTPEFFFDEKVLNIVRGLTDDRVVADQWGCDVVLQGSDYQGIHVDYHRPLFSEVPDLSVPFYMLVVGFGLGPITLEDGPSEIAPGTHGIPRKEALRAVESGETEMQAVPLEVGDVLIRHPWAIHRGSPNTTEMPRALVSIRYVRRWYIDNSRGVCLVPRSVWESLTSEQQSMMLFPIQSA